MQRLKAWQATGCAALLRRRYGGRRLRRRSPTARLTDDHLDGPRDDGDRDDHTRDPAARARRRRRSQRKPHGPAESGRGRPAARRPSSARPRGEPCADYVRALDDRDGRAVAPAARPRRRSPRSSCPAAAAAACAVARRLDRLSRPARPAGLAGAGWRPIRRVELDGRRRERATVTATTVTRFADRAEALGRGRHRLPAARAAGAGSWRSRARPFTVRSGSPTSPRLCSPRRGRTRSVAPRGRSGRSPIERPTRQPPPWPPSRHRKEAR